MGINLEGDNALLHSVVDNEAIIDKLKKADGGAWSCLQLKPWEEFWRLRTERAKVLKINGGRDPSGK